jgi:hypothetical protein
LSQRCGASLSETELSGMPEGIPAHVRRVMKQLGKGHDTVDEFDVVGDISVSQGGIPMSRAIAC